MKELKITQCSVGKYNLFGNEETLAFYAGIFEGGKHIEIDGVKAIIHYSGDPDEKDDFTLDNIDWVFEKCFKYATNIWSTRDYLAECLTFAKVYGENYEEIDANLVKKHKEKIEKQIEELQRKLNYTTIVNEIDSNYWVDKEISKYQKWIDGSKLSDFVEGSESYIKEKSKIDGYKSKIEYFEKFKIQEEV